MKTINFRKYLTTVLIAGLVGIVQSLTTIQAGVYYVTPEADAAGGDVAGTGWTSPGSLQGALNKAENESSVIIFVKKGEYTAPIRPSSDGSFDKGFKAYPGKTSAVTIYGNCEGTENENNLPVINKNTPIETYLKATQGRVITNYRSHARWIGFDISGGNASTVNSANGGNTRNGGGVYLGGGTLEFCKIHDNTAVQGAGVWVSTENLNDGDKAYSGRIENSQIYSNTSQHFAPANQADILGGGVFLASAETSITNSVVRGNTTTANSNYGKGGGIYVRNEAKAINCLVINNTAPQGAGGGIYFGTTGGSAINCTVVGNSSNNDGGGICGETQATAKATNCISRNNTNTSGLNINLNFLTASHSTGSGAYAGNNGNLANIDPLFVDAVNGDYSLQATSLCIDVGDNAANTLPTDLDGEIRIFGETIDIGAYEYTVYHTITLPEIEGIALTPATTQNSVLKFTDFEFSFTVDADYDESAPVVTVSRDGGITDETLSAVEGTYTITDVRSDIEVSITGIELNPEYTVTLPAVAGIAITPSETENAVRSGHDFEFSFTVDADYDQSVPVVKISRDGGVTEETLSLADGKYTITNVRSDITVTIIGIVENPTVGITPVNGNAVKVSVSGNTLKIESPLNGSAAVYTVTGTKQAEVIVSGSKEIALPAGIYLVRFNGQSHKVLIK
jgi:hypothetical protein